MMPSPKSGTPGNLVAPVVPEEALDADDADPGQVESVKAGQRQTKSGKYGSTPVKAFKPEDPPPEQPAAGEAPKKVSWIEIVLVDANDKPVAGEPYKITLPDDSVKEGTLDDKGFARVDGCDPGTCKVTFPQMDGRSWKKQ